jgi:hypothetical protein
MVGRTLGGVNVSRAKLIFSLAPNRYAGSASRSERIPGIGMPRECPLAFRSARAIAGIGSDHPSQSPQPAAMLGVALRKKRDNASGTQTLTDCLSVVTTVA